jgi:hypothetical protein
MSKLRAFQFQPQNDIHSDDARALGLAEVAQGNSENDKTEGKRSVIQATPLNPSSSQKSLEKDLRECPQTPVGRLPLAELIAGGKDINSSGGDLAPIERVLWNHSQQSVDSNGSPGRRSAKKRGKKRSHSSSPPASRNAPRKSLAREISKFENLQAFLKTPQADPVNDLWSRYSLGTDKPSPTRRTKTAMANLLHSSSPQTPTAHLDGRDSAKLRRSYSCNTEWPTSAKKRRKLQYSSSNQETTVGYATYEQGYEANGKSKIARVTLLVEQIQNRLARANTQDDENEMHPSSSRLDSEIDARAKTGVLDQGIPLTGGPKHATLAKNGISNAAVIDRFQGLSPNNGRGDDHDKGGGGDEGGESHDFHDFHEDQGAGFDDLDDYDSELMRTMGEEAGLDDLDDDDSELVRTADEAENFHSSVPTYWSPPSFPTTSTDLYAPITEAMIKRPSKTQDAEVPDRFKTGIHHSSAEAQSPELDEFDDDNSEAFAADLEDIVAKYDTEPQLEVRKLANRISNTTEILTKPTSKTFGDTASLNVRKASPVGNALTSEPGSDDEFGGDFDFENIIAQCKEASQTPHSASEAQSFVCTRTFGPSI